MLVAAKRELLEESGYTSNDIQLWKIVEDTGIFMWRRGIYIARNCIKKQSVTPDNGEKISSRLVSFDDFLLLSENPLFRGKSGLKDILFMARLHKEKYNELKNLLDL